MQHDDHRPARRAYHRPAIVATARPEGTDCRALAMTLRPEGPDYMGWLSAWVWAMETLPGSSSSPYHRTVRRTVVNDHRNQ